jgi:hypothetical protein
MGFTPPTDPSVVDVAVFDDHGRRSFQRGEEDRGGGRRAEVRQKKKLDPRVIRVGDVVEVVDARRVVRVGYPKAVADYEALVKEKFAQELRAMFGPHAVGAVRHWRERGVSSHDEEEGSRKQLLGGVKYNALQKVVRELAYVEAKADHFGGRERSVHLVDAPEWAGRRCQVASVVTAMTGKYYGPSGGGYNSYEGDYDWEPGGLAGAKAVRIAELHYDLVVAGGGSYPAGAFGTVKSGKIVTFDPSPVRFPTSHLRKVEP